MGIFTPFYPANFLDLDHKTVLFWTVRELEAFLLCKCQPLLVGFLRIRALSEAQLRRHIQQIQILPQDGGHQNQLQICPPGETVGICYKFCYKFLVCYMVAPLVLVTQLHHLHVHMWTIQPSRGWHHLQGGYRNFVFFFHQSTWE